MNTHPDVMWELVRDRQARLRKEAEHQNRLTKILRKHRGVHRWAE
jgi:hypothetical protein